MIFELVAGTWGGGSPWASSSSKPTTEMGPSQFARPRAAASEGASPTNLPTRVQRIEDDSVDLLVCLQAFHWFDAGAALKEFHRVLKPNGEKGVLLASYFPALFCCVPPLP